MSLSSIDAYQLTSRHFLQGQNTSSIFLLLCSQHCDRICLASSYAQENHSICHRAHLIQMTHGTQPHDSRPCSEVWGHCCLCNTRVWDVVNRSKRGRKGHKSYRWQNRHPQSIGNILNSTIMWALWHRLKSDFWHYTGISTIWIKSLIQTARRWTRYGAVRISEGLLYFYHTSIVLL